MSRIVLLFILGIFFTFSTAGYLRGQDKTPQEDSLKSVPVWDFGKIKQGQVVKHTFIFKNESIQPLNIKEVSTSCGCTVSQIKKRSLRPKEATEIQVQFNSKGYSGPVEQSTFVTTDSLDSPVLRFIIKADVEK